MLYISALLTTLLLITSCKHADKLVVDQYPATMDRDVYQTRLEFSGCGHEIQVGGIACYPEHQEIKIRTEFQGNVLTISSGTGCRFYEEVSATIPYTTLKLPKVDRICNLSVFYQPKFTPEPTEEIRGVFGEISIQPDPKYVYLGHISVNLFQDVVIPIPDSYVRGFYINRFVEDPVEFKDKVQYPAPSLDTDLLQLKLFDVKGEAHYFIYTVNYYSPKAKNLTVNLEKSSKNKVKVVLPNEVTIVSIGGDLQFWRSFELDKSLSVVIRAYTIQGRTLVFKVNKGAIEWIK